MKHASRAIPIVVRLSSSLGFVAIFGALVPAPIRADNDVTRHIRHERGWVVTSLAQLQSHHTPGDDSGKLREEKALVVKLTAADADTIRRWDVSGPADLKPVFPPPNHPSCPAAHGGLSTAAAMVLVAFFPCDRERLLALTDASAPVPQVS